MVQQKRRVLGKTLRQSLPQNIHILLFGFLGSRALLRKHFLRSFQCSSDSIQCDIRDTVIVLLVRNCILQPHADLLLRLASGDLPEQSQDVILPIREDDIPAREELQKQMIHAIAKREVDDAVCPDLLDGGHPARLEGFAEARDELRGSRCGCSRVLRDMAAETGVDDELSAVVWLCELEQKDSLRGRRRISWVCTNSTRPAIETFSDLPTRDHRCWILVG